MISLPRIRFLSFRYFSEALTECGFSLEVLLPKSLLASNLKGLKKSFLPRDLRLYKEYPNQIVNAFTIYTIKLLMHSCVPISIFMYTKEVR